MTRSAEASLPWPRIWHYRCGGISHDLHSHRAVCPQLARPVCSRPADRAGRDARRAHCNDLAREDNMGGRVRLCNHSRRIWIKIVDDLPDGEEVIRFGEDKLTLVEEKGDCERRALQRF